MAGGPGSRKILRRRAGARNFRWRAAGCGSFRAKAARSIAYAPQARRPAELPAPATEPPPPEKTAGADELYVTGLHLEQYRHATRPPDLYWREALRRDPLDARCNNAMGLWHLRRGELDAARKCFQTAIERLTLRNANPYDGEPYYNLGLCLCLMPDAGGSPEDAARLLAEAGDALHKAAWNQAWQSAACHAAGGTGLPPADWTGALEHLDRSLRANADNSRARNLRSIVLDKMNRRAEAESSLRETLALDPLDGWACQLSGREMPGGAQMRLDIALDFARAGLYAEAIELLRAAPGKTKSDSRPAGTEAADLRLGRRAAGPLLSGLAP